MAKQRHRLKLAPLLYKNPLRCQKPIANTNHVDMNNHGKHRRAVIILFSLVVNFTTAQSQQILSLHPLFTEQTAVLMRGIASEWRSGDHNFLISIKQLGDNFYQVSFDSATNGACYEAVFVAVANRTFLDLSPKLPDTLGNKDYRSQVLCAHSLYDVKLVNDTLQFSALSYRFFYDQLAINNSLLSYTVSSDGFLLVASTEELSQFILEHVKEPGFFGDTILLIRTSKPGSDDKKSAAPFFANPVDRNFYQPCAPEFPQKDGWLGGDTDVSVPINDTQSLYLFGDTDVGGKGDNRKAKDIKMVSSSVAIATCSPGGKKQINYYWRNMYSNHPEPVFRSLTNRYNLWVTNAFLNNNSLYVLLEKTGAKAGVSPDDFFPFSFVGLTLAKVVNPMATTPDKWNIEFIPLSLFAFPMNKLHITLTKRGRYLYFFAEYDSKVRLLRLDLSFIDSPQNHFEYYSLAHKWKWGVKVNDMEIVLSAQVGSTITYHEELKKWVMVCGPAFMNNKIGLRTATSLTGPWSEQTVVYECPEVTPGTPTYRPSHFCYFGRECFQNYDKKNRTMVITYDINSSDFFEINANPQIYTPKVITVPLRKYGFR